MSRTDCNLFKEWARGIMYRSGREMDDFLAVYVTGLIVFGILLVALFLAEVCLGN